MLAIIPVPTVQSVSQACLPFQSQGRLEPNSDSGRIFTWHLTLALLNLIIYCSVVSLTCCLIRAKSTMDTPGSVLEKWDWNWFCMSSQVKIELGRRLTYQVKAWPVNELGKSLNFGESAFVPTLESKSSHVL